MGHSYITLTGGDLLDDAGSLARRSCYELNSRPELHHLVVTWMVWFGFAFQWYFESIAFHVPGRVGHDGPMH